MAITFLACSGFARVSRYVTWQSLRSVHTTKNLLKAEAEEIPFYRKVPEHKPKKFRIIPQRLYYKLLSLRKYSLPAGLLLILLFQGVAMNVSALMKFGWDHPMNRWNYERRRKLGTLPPEMENAREEIDLLIKAKFGEDLYGPPKPWYRLPDCFYDFSEVWGD